MSKIAIFVLGALLGTSLGYMLIIPSRNEYKKISNECVNDYEKTVKDYKILSGWYKTDTAILAKSLTVCMKDLTECGQDLSLLQGRSR